MVKQSIYTNHTAVSHLQMGNDIMVDDGAITLTEKSYTVKILSGQAWIVIDDQDIVVKAGEVTTVTPGRHPAIISPLGNNTLRLSIEDN